MARTRARSSTDVQPEVTPVQTAAPLRRSTRSTRAIQVVRDLTDDEDEPKVSLKRQAKADKRLSMTSQKAAKDKSPPGPRYNTRSKQIQPSEADTDVASDEDEADVEELPTWPRYKDDLPNAFNGEVDPSEDFISKAPVEIIDNILSFLVLDHDPERGVKMKEGTYKARSHALISMSAMSRLFYHATEGFACRFLTKHKEALSKPYEGDYYRAHPELYQELLDSQAEYNRAREERLSKLRRSSRLANKPQPEVTKVHREELVRMMQNRCAVCFTHCWTRGKFANMVSICETCDLSMNGTTRTLTQARENYDLRDYMLMPKTRKPGPRAKLTDLPAITYGSEYKSVGFPVFKTITVFYFRAKDLSMLANIVHGGNWMQHMSGKWREQAVRQEKARTKRVRQFIIQHHERELEVSKGKAAKRHQKRLDTLRALPLNEKEPHVRNVFGCTKGFCYHDVGLCTTCGDIPGRGREACPECHDFWVDKRFDEFFSKSLPQPVSENQGA